MLAYVHLLTGACELQCYEAYAEVPEEGDARAMSELHPMGEVARTVATSTAAGHPEATLAPKRTPTKASLPASSSWEVPNAGTPSRTAMDCC